MLTLNQDRWRCRYQSYLYFVGGVSSTQADGSMVTVTTHAGVDVSQLDFDIADFISAGIVVRNSRLYALDTTGSSDQIRTYRLTQIYKLSRIYFDLAIRFVDFDSLAALATNTLN